MSVSPAESRIWGSLYTSAELRELFSDHSQLQLMLDVEAALARAEARIGLIPQAVAEAVTSAARVENLDLDKIATSTRRVGYPVVALVEELGRVAGADAARHIHLGATTQDILDTALVLQLRAATTVIRRELVALARALAQRAKQYRDTPMAGRTHLQHAVPITFGFKCAVWTAPMISHIERLDQALRRGLVVEFGGAAGTLAALGNDGPSVVEALARELNLGVPLIAWHSIRDRIAEIATVMGLISGSLAKFALDISLLMQTEVGEVSEPIGEGRGASSTMPQKRNPISSEYVMAAARGVQAAVPLLLAAMASDHERSTGPWQSESLAIAQVLCLTGGALSHARSIGEGMVVDTERMRRNLELTSGAIMSEAVATRLTKSMGRVAAEAAVKRVVNRSIGEARSLAATLRDDPLLRPLLSDDELARLLDPAAYLGAAGIFVDRVVAQASALA